ncbi:MULTISPECIES: hypothetical protein [unclassified Leclercia]|uniref:hypothetical protein n=1 Tax=unclassified Leclercia TaxID=2627398 RepID=UPI000DF12BD9|nr:hypothetical protein [Leclercia sp. W17]AXF67381.1 hypothetical protein DVA44_25460 [Leclercia sp. W17]MCG1034680.1 hypothetical protein [Bacillus amyloliquefaciens]
MNKVMISFVTAYAAVSFLQDRLGHRRIWITKFYVGVAGVGYYYALVDCNHRVLADWDQDTCCWDLRSEAWIIVPESRDYLPEDVLTEVISKWQLFQLSMLEGFA